jgi:hypothetical protein
MATSLRTPGVVTALDDFTVTIRAKDGTLRRATRGPAFHSWVEQLGIKRNCKFTNEPEVGDVVSFVTSDSIETVVEEQAPVAVTEAPVAVTEAPVAVTEATAPKPRRAHRRTTGARTVKRVKGTKTMADAHA